MNQKQRIEELERRVRELEARPQQVHNHYHYNYQYPPNVYAPTWPTYPWTGPWISTTDVSAGSPTVAPPGTSVSGSAFTFNG